MGTDPSTRKLTQDDKIVGASIARPLVGYRTVVTIRADVVIGPYDCVSLRGGEADVAIRIPRLPLGEAVAKIGYSEPILVTDEGHN